MRDHVHRLVITGAIASMLMMVTTAPGRPQCVVEDAYEPSQVLGAYGIQAYVLAQSFIPSRPYVLDAVEVPLDLTHSAQITAYIQDDFTASPGLVYAQVTISVTETGWQRFDLPDMDVMSGFTYYIRLGGDAALWGCSDADPYLGGEGFLNGSLAPFDFLFRTCSPNEPRCAVEEGYDPEASAGWLNAFQYILAQSFTPSSSFSASGVEALLRFDSPVSLTATIQDDPTSLPGVIFAQTTASFAGPGFLHFDLPATTITAGTTYYLRISGPASWYYADQPPYTGGASFVNGQLSASDFLFRVCGEPSPVATESWGAIKATCR